MTIELITKCDKCGNWINEREEIYCLTCFSELKNKISDLEDKIGKLEDEITGLEADLDTAYGGGLND